MPTNIEMAPQDTQQGESALPSQDQISQDDTGIENAASQQAPQQQQSPVIPNVEVPMPPQAPTPEERHAQDMATMQDAATKQITPQTYASMFADKGTLGKIGSVFGLLLSGAGSALAHQPDALLDMMNKQISNDLERQKSNVTNAQSFLSTAFQHELQQAEIKRYEYENALTQTQMPVAGAQVEQAKALTAKTKAEQVGVEAENLKKQIEAQQWKNSLPPTAPVNNGGPQTAPANATPQQGGGSGVIPLPPANQPPHPNDIKSAAVAAPFRAENNMRIAAVQHLSDAVANNPQGQAVLKNQVIPATIGINQQNNLKEAAAQAAAFAPEQALYGSVVTDPNLLMQKIAQNKLNPSIPGSIPESVATTEKAALEKHRMLYAQAVDAAKQLANMPQHGQMNPYGAAALHGLGGIGGWILGALGSKSNAGGAATGAVGIEGAQTIQEYQERERTKLTKILKNAGIDADAIMPSRADTTPDSLATSWDAMNKAFLAQDAGLAPTLKLYGLKTPFPTQEYVGGSRANPTQGTERFNAAEANEKANEDAIMEGMKRMAK